MVDIDGEFIELPKEMANFRMFTSGTPGKEKFHIAGVIEGYHLTFHSGGYSKIFDIHLKRERDEKYLTVFKMRHFTISRMLYILNTFVKYGTRKYLFKNRINFGKLIHQRYVFQKLIPDAKDQNDFCTVVTKSKRSKFKFLEKIKDKDLLKLYVEPGEIYEVDCDFFQIYKYRRNSYTKVGYLYRHANNGKTFFYFIKKREWALYNALIEFGISTSFKRINFERKKAIIHFIDKSIQKKYKGTTILKSVYNDLEVATRKKK